MGTCSMLSAGLGAEHGKLCPFGLLALGDLPNRCFRAFSDCRDKLSRYFFFNPEDNLNVEETPALLAVLSRTQHHTGTG